MLDDAPALDTEHQRLASLVYRVSATAGSAAGRLAVATGGLRDLHDRHRLRIAKLVRYATTSGVALGISEATLLVVYANGVANATLAAGIANLAGTLPSYLMSRYWIWRDAPRERVGRQVALYWLTAVMSMLLTSLATGAIATMAPGGHRYHLAVVGIGYPAVNLVLWLTKFAVYQRIVFPTTRSTAP